MRTSAGPGSGRKKMATGWWWERGFGRGSKSKSSAQPEAESQKVGRGKGAEEGRKRRGGYSLPVLPGSVTVLRVQRLGAPVQVHNTEWVEMLVGGVWLLKFLTRLIPLTATTMATATAFGMTWPISDSGLRQQFFLPVGQSVSRQVHTLVSARTDACRNLTSPKCQIILLEAHWLAAEHGRLTFT